MTRTILATATALVAATTLYTSAANACISCEYVPEVVRSSSNLPHTGQYYAPPRSSYKIVKERSAGAGALAKKRIVKSEPVEKLNTAKADKVESTQTAKVAKVDKAEKVAKAEPTEKTDSENSSISLASADAAPVEKTESAEKAPVVEKAAAAKPTDCKKFFASVGMTLTVPCE